MASKKQSVEQEQLVEQEQPTVETTKEEKVMDATVRFTLTGEKTVQDHQTNKEFTFNSKSDLMRHLYDQGMTIGQISKFMNSHYSFVYGVISSSREIKKAEKHSKSDMIREMFADGQTVGQIAKALNANYSFVFSVVKKFKEQQKAQ